jgi:hypothetical protein
MYPSISLWLLAILQPIKQQENNLACKIYSEWSSCRYPGYFDVVDLVNRQPDDLDGPI